MGLTNKETSNREFIKILPGILVSLAAIVLIVYLVDWQDVYVALIQAELSYIFLGIPVYLIAYLCRAFAWGTLLGKDIPIKKVFITMQIGYLLNNILPLRLGELGRALILGRKGLGFWRVLSTILIERAFDLILAASLLFGTIPFVFDSSQYFQVALIVGVIVLSGMVILHLLARNQDWVIKKIENQKEQRPRLRRLGSTRIEAFLNGLSTLTNVRRFLSVLAWMLVSWGLTIVYQFLVLLAFDPSAKILWSAFGLAVASLGVALPSSPSYVGVLEAAWIGALSLFNVGISTALAYAITVHILHIIISIIFGTFGLIKEGETLNKLYSDLRNRRLE